MTRPMISQREKAQPRHHRQSRHEQDAKKDAQDGDGNSAGRAEATTPLGLAIAQDQHADRDQHEGEEGADIREVGEGADIQQPGWESPPRSRQPRWPRRACGSADVPCRTAGATGGRATWQTTPAPGRAGRPGWRRSCPSCAPQSTNSRTQCRRSRAGLMAELLQRVHHRRGIVHQRLPRDQAGEHDGDPDIEDGADDQRGR